MNCGAHLSSLKTLMGSQSRPFIGTQAIAHLSQHKIPFCSVAVLHLYPMSAIKVEVFANNWSYLRTELSWLDQVLVAAVARHRKHQKEVDRLSQSRADRATHHWWKGIVSLEGNIGYDEHRKQPNPAPTTPPQPKIGYQQQLEMRIKASQQRGIILALPQLRDRLQLSVFEKNVILLGLAPEVNRRYVRLYRYLKGEDDIAQSDLPTVDLVLRLLCRNDQEWCAARKSLTANATLLREGLIEIPSHPTSTRLGSTIRLSDALVDYLLSDQPTLNDLDRLLAPPVELLPAPSLPDPQFFTQQTDSFSFHRLIIPEPLFADIRRLIAQLFVQIKKQIDTIVDFEMQVPSSGRVIGLQGDAGTGKTSVAQVFARELGLPLAILDLAHLEPTHHPAALKELAQHQPKLLLIKSPQYWLGRNAMISNAEVYQFFAQREQLGGITLISANSPMAIQHKWRHQFDHIIELPRPDAALRERLWFQMLFERFDYVPTFPWKQIAQEFDLTGGEIDVVVNDAIVLSLSEKIPYLDIHHILFALWQRGYSLDLKELSSEQADFVLDYFWPERSQFI